MLYIFLLLLNLINNFFLFSLYISGWVPSLYWGPTSTREILCVYLVQSPSGKTEIFQETREENVARRGEEMQRGTHGKQKKNLQLMRGNEITPWMYYMHTHNRRRKEVVLERMCSMSCWKISPGLWKKLSSRSSSSSSHLKPFGDEIVVGISAEQTDN